MRENVEPDSSRCWAAPEFIPSPTLAEWRQQRLRIRSELLRLLGDLPPPPAPLQVKTLSRADHGHYWLEKFYFDNGAGSQVPGYLLLPKRDHPVPALLYCHWHGNDYDIGKEELFRDHATPVPPGPELARRGYAVLAIDASGFGERNGCGPLGITEKGAEGEWTSAKFNLWIGRTLWGMIVRDDLLALDYLCSRREVDPARIGVTGISMGSTRTWWLMALDERPKAAVGICCLTRYQNLIEEKGLSEHGIYYFVPALLRHFDMEAVVALIAPRPMLFVSGEQDPGSPAAGIRQIEQKVELVYALYGARQSFASIIYPRTGHTYTPGMWNRMLDWMAGHL